MARCRRDCEAFGRQMMAALDPAAPRNKDGRNSRGLRPALVRAVGTRPEKFLQRTVVHRDLAPTRSTSNHEKDRHFLLPRRKGQASFASDRRTSREATTCDSHGRESVGHATPRHARVATRRQVSHGRNQTERRWGGTGIPGWTPVRFGMGPGGGFWSVGHRLPSLRDSGSLGVARPPWVRTHGYCMTSLRDLDGRKGQ